MKRIIMKISGEALKGKEYNIDEDNVKKICEEIKKIYDHNFELAIIVGAGNLWRGRNSNDMNGVVADQIGMLGTIMNTLAIGECLKRMGVNIKTRSALPIAGCVKPYSILEGREALENKQVLLIGGGVGNPFCTTDKATVQRALELQADTILFTKSIDGIYSEDPKKNPDAYIYETITHQEVLENHLKNGISSLGVMDIEAEIMLACNPIDTYVYSAKNKDAIDKIINNEKVGTLVKTLVKKNNDR